MTINGEHHHFGAHHLHGHEGHHGHGFGPSHDRPHGRGRGFGHGYGRGGRGPFGGEHGEHGRGQFWGHHRGGVRERLERGTLRYIILDLLSNGPIHGYEIIRQLEERTQGLYSP